MNRRDILKIPAFVSIFGAFSANGFCESGVHKKKLEYLVNAYFDHADSLMLEYGYSSEDLISYFEKHTLMLLSLAYIQTFGTSINSPQWVPYIPFYLPWGIPNPDDVYKNTFIDSDATYRLRGKKGSATIAKLTMKDGGAHLGEISSGKTLAEIDINELESDSSGNFEIYLGKNGSKYHDRQFYVLHQNTTQLMYRSVTKNSSQFDPNISIERLDYKGVDFYQDALDFERTLTAMFRFASVQIEFLLKFKKKRIDLGSDSGFIFDEAQVDHGGMPDQKYLFYTFSLGKDDVLILESEVPDKYKYWNVMLFDEFCNGINAVYHQSSLNDEQVRIDEDGVIRVVVSHQDPGVHNWLDTCGWATGGIMWRWNNASSYPKPKIRKINRKELFDNLPSGVQRIDVDERRKLLGDRIHHYQSRLI
ncbi:MAG: DUF1214 domain-containing protein [Porticoccaceae bacterium]